jgi:hypothetical protein
MMPWPLGESLPHAGDDDASPMREMGVFRIHFGKDYAGAAEGAPLETAGISAGG